MHYSNTFVVGLDPIKEADIFKKIVSELDGKGIEYSVSQYTKSVTIRYTKNIFVDTDRLREVCDIGAIHITNEVIY